MYPDVHCSTIYNSLNIEAKYISINRLMNKEAVLYLYNGTLLSCKKEQICDSCSEVNEPRDSYIK